MTFAQMQRTQAGPALRGVLDDMDASGPRVPDDMTVEVALSVMAGARVEHLLVCDGDDLGTGVVTRARLVALQDSSAYTDQVRLRDVLDGQVFAQLAAVGRPFGPLIHSL